MDAPKNGTNSLFFGTAAALGIAAITGVIGWIFAHVVEISSTMAKIEQMQISDDQHQVVQDRWIDELNKKMDTNQKEMRDVFTQTNTLLNDIRSRMDGKGH